VGRGQEQRRRRRRRAASPSHARAPPSVDGETEEPANARTATVRDDMERPGPRVRRQREQCGDGAGGGD